MNKDVDSFKGNLFNLRKHEFIMMSLSMMGARAYKGRVDGGGSEGEKEKCCVNGVHMGLRV